MLSLFELKVSGQRPCSLHGNFRKQGYPFGGPFKGIMLHLGHKGDTTMLGHAHMALRKDSNGKWWLYQASDRESLHLLDQGV